MPSCTHMLTVDIYLVRILCKELLEHLTRYCHKSSAEQLLEINTNTIFLLEKRTEAQATQVIKPVSRS